MAIGDDLLSLSLNNAALFVTGSDKEAILDLITARSNAQRQEIIAAYKSNFGKVGHQIPSPLYLFVISESIYS